MKGTIN